MKTIIWIAVLLVVAAGGYYFFTQKPADTLDELTMNGKIDINTVCEGALAYMTFPSGAEAEAWVAECKRGEHPEVIEQWKQQTGFPGGSSAMRAEENMVVVMEQRPGNTIIASQVYLAAPGFVVIHEDENGAPGAIIGSSVLLQAGESSKISITLSRPTQDGEKLHAMLHSDTDANGTFSASTDAPVQSILGGPLGGWFEISSEASEELPEITI